ncbi:M20 metallopeptidase family protein [Thiovibrio sp. JS02]
MPDEQLDTWMREIRRHIHQHPELAFQEFATARFIAGKLEELAIPFREQVGQTGIVASLGSNDPAAPCVALRADMDALPLTEETGLPFSSRNPGVMHACGHDGHVAMLLGAAALLSRVSLPGRVVLIFQPAEEGDGGARGMIAAGALNGVSAIFSGHIDRNHELNEIIVQPGLICAFTDEFSIEITGSGGHAAKPHESADSIVAACQLVTSLHTIVSREIHPCLPAVITVGRIHGGTAANVIASRVVLEGTIRSTDPEVRKTCFSAVQRMVAAIGALHRVQATCTLVEGYPPVINDAAASRIARDVAAEIVGSGKVKGQPLPSLGGEDFSFFLEKVPGCMVRFGARRPAPHDAPAHSPRFDFDEDILATGALFFAKTALRALEGIAVSLLPPRR